MFSTESTEGFDYVLGAVHYLKVENEFIPIDENADILKTAAKKFFNGDMYRLVEKYYETVGVLAGKNCNAVAHFDLVTKFNEKEKLFDEKDERYVRACFKAAKKLVNAGKVFEINTGAVARGYKKEAYPAKEITAFIRDNGGMFVLGSDSHHKNGLMFDFEKEVTEKAEMGICFTNEKFPIN